MERKSVSLLVFEIVSLGFGGKSPLKVGRAVCESSRSRERERK